MTKRDDEMQNELKAKEIRNYEIRFYGTLEERHLRWFESVELIPLPEGEMLIKGRIVDQAALFGILNRLRDLNLELLDIRYTIEKTDQ